MKNRSLLLAFLANIIQYYDYALFGLSASMLTKYYMPHNTPSKNMLTFFGIMSVAVIMRPIGSIIFGYLGDRKGRSIVLRTSIFLASISTLLIGVIPTNNDALSTSLLIIARMIFMTSLAGEVDGVRIYVAETIGTKNEFLGNGVVSGSSQIGVLLATFAYFLSSHSNFLEYYWKINFIIGGTLGLILCYFSKYISESIEFRKKDGLEAGTLRQNLPILLYGTIVSGFIGGAYHFQIIFLSAYLTSAVMLLKQDLMNIVNIITISLYILSAVVSGYIADKYNPKKQIILSLILTIICTITNALLMAKNQINLPLLIFTTILITFYSVPLQIILKRRMPIENRLKLFSLSHSLGSLIFSSSSTLIASWLWHVTQAPFAPMIYMIIMSGILLIAVVPLRHNEAL